MSDRDRGKLTDERVRALVESIERGYYASVAARQVGIHPTTYFRWMARGKRAARGVYRDFYERVRAAEAVAENRAVDALLDPASKNWRAALVYLERKFPSRWGSRRVAGGPAASSPKRVQLNPSAEFLQTVEEELDRLGIGPADLGPGPQGAGPEDTNAT